MKNSLEWAGICTDLTAKAGRLANGKDVVRMINNIGISVTELSRAEVDARRGKTCRAEELLSKINTDIELVEEYLLVAALLG